VYRASARTKPSEFTNQRLHRVSKLLHALIAALLIGCTPALLVTHAPAAYGTLTCSPSPKENCHAVYESMMARCDGMPRGPKERRKKAAIDRFADCVKNDGFMGGGGRF
jgi:hypothetical protein